MRTLLLVLLFFVYLLTISALGIAAHGAEPNERWAPAVRDFTVCGTGVVNILGLDPEASVDVGVPTLPEDVVEIFISDETPPLADILSDLFWQTVEAQFGGDAPLVYGPIHQNTGKTKCLVEARDV